MWECRFPVRFVTISTENPRQRVNVSPREQGFSRRVKHPLKKIQVLARHFFSSKFSLPIYTYALRNVE